MWTKFARKNFVEDASPSYYHPKYKVIKMAIKTRMKKEHSKTSFHSGKETKDLIGDRSIFQTLAKIRPL